MNKTCAWFGLFLLWVIAGCRRPATDVFATRQELFFLDSIAAAQAIITDDAENFFDHIRPADIAIQMKSNSDSLGHDAINTYKSFLKTQVENFSAEDIKNLQPLWHKVLSYTRSLNPDIKCTVQLVKIKTDHYGPNVFYTRGTAIFIPENVLKDFKPEVMLPVLIHEWWHVLAEQYPDLKNEVYRIFGFSRHGMVLKFPESLEKRLLTNPDGADLSYAIPLSDGSWLMPVIYSVSQNFEPHKLNFMGHLKMEVVKILKDGTVVVPDPKKAAAQVADMDVFFKVIGDNTQYIIHPDEIAADNFMLALLASQNQNFEKFSKTGKAKADELIKVLRTEKYLK